ncbi:serine/threonine-protein kinase ICK-like [Nannospalax galili]|uniref:serine/threonine-protein kinase ICK-like n=1 Tax=Nannospalax galili TaxID=1026970 RepID=UPI00111C558A|nr:serine/threonine-protein kinase ICK-like [Nannospalax galili]
MHLLWFGIHLLSCCVCELLSLPILPLAVVHAVLYSEVTVLTVIHFPPKSRNLLLCIDVVEYIFVVIGFRFCLSVGSGSTSSSRLTGSYIPSFLKKEIGSAMQRVHLAPIPDPSPGYSSLKAVRPHPGRPFLHTQPRSTPGLIPRPPAAQPVQGRMDWASKYPSHR